MTANETDKTYIRGRVAKHSIHRFLAKHPDYKVLQIAKRQKLSNTSLITK